MNKRKGPAHRSASEDGFTLVELLVVIAIIALLMAILLPALGRARELGKRAVCMSQIKQLGTAWYMYCDDNKERVPVGDVWYSWTYPNTPPVGIWYTQKQLAWHEWPHPFPHAMPPTQNTNAMPRTDPVYGMDCAGCKQADWRHAISEGTLWRWVNDYKVYKCPVGVKGQEVTYALSHAMATYPGSAGSSTTSAPRLITLRSDIRRTAERFVFLDAGQAKQGAFFLDYGPDVASGAPPGSFGDHRPTRHGQGTTFVFADQHVEYHKWLFATATATVETGGWGGTSQPCDCDWRWFCKVTWGDVPLDCTTTGGKKCDY
ncbi:MAG: prepilin-type N-terminal cleavage/methylation domain-containing protein [Sedimentisphaerales bacterium]